jgi:hypothetical protein
VSCFLHDSATCAIYPPVPCHHLFIPDAERLYEGLFSMQTDTPPFRTVLFPAPCPDAAMPYAPRRAVSDCPECELCPQIGQHGQSRILVD